MTDGPRPEVSVLVPCYNAERSIRRAIDSVLEETAFALEVVVVDDASTDGTLDVSRGIAASDARVRVVALEANGGVSNARNRGLEAVRGEWLTLLDADDRFTPGGLGALYRAALAGDALAVVGQQVWSDGRHDWLGPLYDIPDIRTPGRTSLAARPGLLYYASPHGKLVRRAIVEDLRFSGRVLGDQPWVIRAMLRAGNRLEVIGDTVYEWIRTAPPGAGPSITAATRSSAARGVEAAGIAAEAFGLVAAEIGRVVPERDAAERLRAAYAERLLRSDLGVHLARALGRRDPELGELFDGLGAFIRAIPPATLRRTPAIASELIAPPLRRWSAVTPGARPAFWSLADACLAVQPDLAARAADPVAGWAIRRGLSSRSSAGGPPTRLGLSVSAAAQALPDLPRRGAAGLRRLGLWPG